MHVRTGPEYCDQCRYSESICGKCYDIIFAGRATMKIDTTKIDCKCPHCDGSGEIEHDAGSRLIWLRKQSGQTQDQLAEALATSRPALANMEAGKQNITQQNIKLICRHFGISADWFLGLNE